ncbi:MAG: hypothetical protein ACTJGD_08280 [Mesonia hippocampi]|uniref:hypothetical protein n=1 Tax=Mesonia hippocampi TaxID=1628250 RepID=UPI003F9670AA
MNNDKKLAIVLFTGIGILLIYIAISTYITNQKWDDPKLNKSYTIGLIEDFERGAKSPPVYKYYFHVDGLKYSNDHLIVSQLRLLGEEKLKKIVGKRFYVKFIAEDPSYSKLLMGYPVPDSIKEAPVRGWKKLPR